MGSVEPVDRRNLSLGLIDLMPRSQTPQSREAASPRQAKDHVAETLARTLAHQEAAVRFIRELDGFGHASRLNIRRI